MPGDKVQQKETEGTKIPKDWIKRCPYPRTSGQSEVLQPCES
jgi:hypothetical protein